MAAAALHPNGKWDGGGGTSSAAPLVGGMVALLNEVRWFKNGRHECCRREQGHHPMHCA
jgi:hypothetical protein